MIKLSKRDNRSLETKAKSDIAHLRTALKKEPIIIKMFKKYNRDINEIDTASIQFDDSLDVSAKTIDGEIFLNAKMLEDDWQEYMHYLVHEFEHYCQHRSNKCLENNKEVDYLDNPSEISAFKGQLKYKEKTEPKKEVNKYLKDLFDKHDIPKDERPIKKKELLDE